MGQLTDLEYQNNMSEVLAGPTREEAHALSRQKPYAKEESLAKDLTKIASSRRQFLTGAAAAGGALAAGALAGAAPAKAEPLKVPEWSKSMGRPIEQKVYGMPSKYEAHVFRERSAVFVNRQNFSDWSMTPLQYQEGITTPSGLIFERHHAGIADIDPKEHRLVIHGMVKRPLVFTMDDLMRYPSVSRFHFLECSGNTLVAIVKNSKNVQQSHGLLSCAQWTGVPLSALLDEAGIDPAGKWLLFEGADGSAHARSIPIAKSLQDVLIVYGCNGEMLRPENGYPIRAFIPGWEGNVSVKWLRRIKVADKPWHLRSETARYTDPMPGGKWRQFSMEMECKSIITSPHGDMQLKGPGLYEIKGFAWSGNGAIKAVDVSTDGGKNWREAQLEEPVLDKCLTRFRYRWNWDGAPTKIASRAVDSTGYVQPTVAELASKREWAGFVQHHNGIFPWSVTAKGEVKNENV